MVKSIRLLILSLLLLISISPTSLGTPSTTSGIVRIAVRDRHSTWMWQGTGFHTNGRVVTAWHVINGHAEVRIHTQDNRVYQASLWRQIKHRDIGLVYFNVEIPNIENYRVVDKDPIGEFQTRCAGHWGRTFLSGVPTVSFGMTSMAAISSDLYLSTNIIELGMSGSPLFINNIVIGVASSKTADMSISGGSLFTKLRDQDLR